MIGIPTMYWATLVAVTISFFLLWKVWVLTKLLQDKDNKKEDQSQLIKDLEDNIRHLREIKERREHD